MATLLELAERVEAAGGPDRELDADIANAVDLRAEDLVCDRLPAYTASLDAAMTLVPEGAVWGVSCDDERPGLFRATIMPLRPPDQTRYCATAALALTAACLRALAAKE